MTVWVCWCIMDNNLKKTHQFINHNPNSKWTKSQPICHNSHIYGVFILYIERLLRYVENWMTKNMTQEQAKGLRAHDMVVIVAIFVIFAMSTESFVLVSYGRAMKVVMISKRKNGTMSNSSSLIMGMLPRGTVPPSGPSQCHNRLTPLKDIGYTSNCP